VKSADDYQDNPVVPAEVNDVDGDEQRAREMAEALLRSWVHAPELTVREVRMILATYSLGGR
jgi:hypothetical protein